MLHFWALEVERNVDGPPDPDPVEFLQRAYEQTVAATSSPNQWLGTTTTATALLHYSTDTGNPRPLLYVTNIGDCQILVIRPDEKRIVFKTEGQWHWFDCPLQLGTNSLDRPREHAAMTKIKLEENDIVVAVSDGVTDNLWEHEVLTVILESLGKLEAPEGTGAAVERRVASEKGMVYVARQLLHAAKVIAQDPFAESPYMEKAIDEGLSIEGGMSSLSPSTEYSSHGSKAKWTTSVWLLRLVSGEVDEAYGYPTLSKALPREEISFQRPIQESRPLNV
jgi:protein phosphatase PTC7